mmetsp:Transcript_86975/g.243823  ORF Transcript_86975/g.243823 Transcript_86975/m.243823 type:complete len:128 (+) Transcript_86975:2040-2423(+)
MLVPPVPALPLAVLPPLCGDAPSLDEDRDVGDGRAESFDEQASDGEPACGSVDFRPPAAPALEAQAPPAPSPVAPKNDELVSGPGWSPDSVASENGGALPPERPFCKHRWKYAFCWRRALFASVSFR